MAVASAGKLIAVFFSSTIYVGRTCPVAVSYFHFNFWETLLAVAGGGIFSSFCFSYFFYGVITWYNRFMDKKYPERKKRKKFTRRNRFLIKVKKYFGVAGIAAVSTLILSIPLGTFLSVRFFGGRTKVFLWFSFFSVLWTLILFFSFGGLNN
jgi:hypothetical protein